MVLDRVRSKSALVTLAGIAVFLVETAGSVAFGRLNADEGWYLYGSQLVFQGLLPYRDFAYTQMPLLPYIYGLPQLVVHSLLLGRLTSAVFSASALIMSIAVARRYAGAWAGAFTALLFAAFTPGIYLNSIVKTYALLTFCFAGALFILSSDLSDRVRYPLALVFALAAALVRVTAGLFAAPVMLYAFLRADRRTRIIILFEGLAAVGIATFFLLPNWAGARWAILSSHLRHWGALSIPERLSIIVTERVPDILQTFAPLVLLGAVALYVILSWRKPWQRDPLALTAVGLGLVLFASSHLVNGLWESEYLIPAASGLLPIIAIGIGRLPVSASRATRAIVWGAATLLPAALVLGEGTQYLDWSGGQTALAEVGQVAASLRANSAPGDRVLVLEGLGAVFEADRQALPGLSLAEFSLQNFDTVTAEQYRVVNMDMLVNAVTRKAARLVVLTERDWGVMDVMPAGQAPFRRALDERYDRIATFRDFGQFNSVLQVYSARYKMR